MALVTHVVESLAEQDSKSRDARRLSGTSGPFQFEADVMLRAGG